MWHHRSISRHLSRTCRHRLQRAQPTQWRCPAAVYQQQKRANSSGNDETSSNQNSNSNNLRRVHTLFGGEANLDLFLLPETTLAERLLHVCAGAWSIVSSQESGDEFTMLVDNQVIKEGVLRKSSAWVTQTIALFHNLQSPLWKSSQFDVKEFMEAVGPALENYLELYNDFVSRGREHGIKLIDDGTQSQQKTSSSSDGDEAEAQEQQFEIIMEGLQNLRNGMPGLISEAFDRADQDPNSVEGRYLQMVNDMNFNLTYHDAVLHALGKFAHSDADSTTYEYIPGSIRVTDVALLNARAMELPTESQREHGDNKEPEEDESSSTEITVAAQIDVLCEVTASFTATTVSKDDSKKDSDDSQADDKPSNQTEEVTEIGLQVAAFEGILNNGDLRWKLATIRNPVEFPDAISLHKFFNN